MKLIEPKVELITQEPEIEGIYKQIEKAGRICYKSEDKITEDSAKGFVDRMIKSGHGAVLEHGTVYLSREVDFSDSVFETFYGQNPYSKVTYDGGYCYVSTNLRTIVENHRLYDLKYLCEPTEFHEKRYTLKFTTSIGITRELTRHRKFSFACESTRYCNYSKDKFNNELTFIKPYWYDKFNESFNEDGYRENGTSDMFTSKGDFEDFLNNCECCYKAALIAGATPQEAREVLPLCTKSEIIMTGFKSDWEAFFKLRCDKAAHPDMQIIANKAKELLNM